jgi:hypothetical protein
MEGDNGEPFRAGRGTAKAPPTGSQWEAPHGVGQAFAWVSRCRIPPFGILVVVTVRVS